MTPSRKPTDLFTQAAAAAAMGVTRAAVANRLARGGFQGDVLEVHGTTLITRRGLSRWAAERRRQAQKRTKPLTAPSTIS